MLKYLEYFTKSNVKRMQSIIKYCTDIQTTSSTESLKIHTFLNDSIDGQPEIMKSTQQKAVTMKNSKHYIESYCLYHRVSSEC